MTAQPMLPKLTIGLDLSDTSSRYCAVDERGQVVATGRVRTSPAALEREGTRWPPARAVLTIALFDLIASYLQDSTTTIRCGGRSGLCTRHRCCGASRRRGADRHVSYTERQRFHRAGKGNGG